MSSSFPKPSDLFINGLSFFGAVVPGAIIIYAARQVAISRGVIGAGEWPNDQFDWAVLLILSLAIGYLAHPPAHILNVAYDYTYAPWRRRNGDPLLDKTREAVNAHIGRDGSVYAYAKSAVSLKSPPQGEKIDQIEGISKMFRTLSFASLIASIASLILNDKIFAASFAILFVLGFLVFCQKRLSATNEVYQSYLSLFTLSKSIKNRK